MRKNRPVREKRGVRHKNHAGIRLTKTGKIRHTQRTSLRQHQIKNDGIEPIGLNRLDRIISGHHVLRHRTKTLKMTGPHTTKLKTALNNENTHLKLPR